MGDQGGAGVEGAGHATVTGAFGARLNQPAHLARKRSETALRVSYSVSHGVVIGFDNLEQGGVGEIKLRRAKEMTIPAARVLIQTTNYNHPAKFAEQMTVLELFKRDLDRVYHLKDLVKGDCIFAATGVTDGSLLAGVKRLPGGRMTTESVVMRASSGTVRWVRGDHRIG